MRSSKHLEKVLEMGKDKDDKKEYEDLDPDEHVDYDAVTLAKFAKLLNPSIDMDHAYEVLLEALAEDDFALESIDDLVDDIMSAPDRGSVH